MLACPLTRIEMSYNRFRNQKGPHMMTKEFDMALIGANHGPKKKNDL